MLDLPGWHLRILRARNGPGILLIACSLVALAEVDPRIAHRVRQRCGRSNPVSHRGGVVSEDAHEKVHDALAVIAERLPDETSKATGTASQVPVAGQAPT